ncbi:MAG TPA: hypothetical protein VMU06_20385 [Stellaceae bacterium]|jgi:hypothetical protein|nr:hypothetical protein [Stellaceae bacterium]
MPATVYYHRGYIVRGFGYGLSFGNALAIAIGWSQTHSVLWTIIDGILSWLYVIYYLLFLS